MNKRRNKRHQVKPDFRSFTWAGDNMRTWIKRLLPPGGVAFLTWCIQGWNADVLLRLKIMVIFVLAIMLFIAVHYFRYRRQQS